MQNSFWLQTAASIQPRTSRLKFGNVETHTRGRLVDPAPPSHASLPMTPRFDMATAFLMGGGGRVNRWGARRVAGMRSSLLLPIFLDLKNPGRVRR